MFALFGLSCTRFAVTICPALLKSLSVGALLAGMARYRRAYCDRRGKSFSWNFHQWSGSSSPSIVGNCKYRAISLAARSRGDWAGDGECLIFLILVREPRFFFLAFLVGGGWLLGSSTISSGYYTKQWRFHFYESSHIFCDHTYSVYTIKLLMCLLLEFVISVNHTRVF